MRHAEKVPVHVPFYDPNHKEEASTNPGACPVKGLSSSIGSALPVSAGKGACTKLQKDPEHHTP